MWLRLAHPPFTTCHARNSTAFDSLLPREEGIRRVASRAGAPPSVPSTQSLLGASHAVAHPVLLLFHLDDIKWPTRRFQKHPQSPGQSNHSFDHSSQAGCWRQCSAHHACFVTLDRKAEASNHLLSFPFGDEVSSSTSILRPPAHHSAIVCPTFLCLPSAEAGGLLDCLPPPSLCCSVGITVARLIFHRFHFRLASRGRES